MLVSLFAVLLGILFVLTMLIRLKIQRLSGWIAILAPITAAIMFITQIPKVLKGQYVVENLEWLPTYDVNLSFRLDGLGLFFALLISLIGVAVFFYATQYLSPKKEALPRFYSYFVLFMMSMLGIVTSNNTILMYIFWELTSVSSFLLISYWYDNKDSQNGAITSFMITVFGGLAMLVGFLLLYVVTGTNTITAQIAQYDKIIASPLFIPIVLLILLGAFTKSAQWPFHFWLPKAMAAPTPVSAYLHSATMVKAGIFLLLRYTPILGHSDLYMYSVTAIGLITMIYGSFTAIRQYDLKGILAYSTISQLGMIMTMIGLGSGIVKAEDSMMAELYAAILFGGMFHLLNHALFKGALFMGVGLIDHEMGTRDIRALGGLKRFLPITMIVMTLAALSMAGVPFLNGFISKEMFFEGLLHVYEFGTFNIIGASLVVITGFVASLFTFIYALNMIKVTFLGKIPSSEKIHEPKLFIMPATIMAILLPTIFIFPEQVGHYIIEPAFLNVTGAHHFMHFAPTLKQWHGINTAFMMSMIVIVIGATCVFLIDWKKWLTSGKEKWALHTLLERGYRMCETSTSFVLKAIMHNRLNSYLMITLIVYVALNLYGLTVVGVPELYQIDIYEYHIFHIILLLTVVIIGIALIFIRQRLTMVILTGGIGYTVALFYILMRAPDLALTQLVTETITTVLFIVSFSRLPNIPRGRFKAKVELTKIGIALVMAFTVVSFVFMIQQTNSYESISIFYHDAYEKSGGKNIVNAILGDFRALDTLSEGVVLIIAGLGIYTLLNYRDRRGQDERE
nr:DUF4040 family protein [Staphylococcus canis]